MKGNFLNRGLKCFLAGSQSVFKFGQISQCSASSGNLAWLLPWCPCGPWLPKYWSERRHLARLRGRSRDPASPEERSPSALSTRIIRPSKYLYLWAPPAGHPPPTTCPSPASPAQAQARKARKGPGSLVVGAWCRLLIVAHETPGLGQSGEGGQSPGSMVSTEVCQETVFLALDTRASLSACSLLCSQS